MPRLRNELTGAVMSVSDSTAARLGREWVDADKSVEVEPKSPARPRKSAVAE